MLQIHDLSFVPFITSTEIEEAIAKVAQQINKDYTHKTPLFLGVLNGAYAFTAALTKKITGNCEVEFTKLKSYAGTTSTGNIQNLIGVGNLKGKDVIVVEDIVDTGNTISEIVKILEAEEVASYRIATLCYKPEAYKKSYKIDYIGLEIPNKFIVGYGLDYDGLGRNLPEIYQLK
ncbi:hypoxanthine phosphoribosyltransferase [Mesonia phycicola]|uniref:Hypoxanthine phosphoribosyltransferase n=1 Tax=Mesonia phycicola TaxID=579105 RepID=A0A1M6B0E0_9FLAO|nr:hypoxanthine phosphoribosyltransferase [Mesonia phycicola]SHI42147.1 hypoxanthine phosphoribosyltransferase [Mesonia phycicola]